jgi:hypothetical protein
LFSVWYSNNKTETHEKIDLFVDGTFSHIGFSHFLKPKQSAYKQVYEAAKEREMQQTASQPTVVKDAATLPPVEVSVRKEKVEPVLASRCCQFEEI